MNIHKSIKFIASVSTLCAVMALSNVANASNLGHGADHGSPKHHQKSKDHRGSKMKRMIRALSLSEQQQVQIKAIKSQAKVQHNSMRDSMKEYRSKAKTLIQTEKFDEPAFVALQAAYQASFEQLGLAKAKTKHAIFNVLTTEQQSKWLTMMEKRKEKYFRD